MVYGGYWASRFAFTASRIYVNVVPDFNGEILELDLKIRIRIRHPLILLIHGFFFMREPAIRRFGIFKPAGGAHEHGA